MLTEKTILDTLTHVKDPELGIDLIELGLIRKITIDEEGVEILMTLTSPFCPFADTLIGQVEKEIGKLQDSGAVRVEITFDPPWEPSDELKEKLGL